ncbi:RNA dependent RNA polymerase-domain-containing protein [Clohesyomyces aquaticus]|uniref:RNA-dependent RNA polymerase n=1 Tax=Clohesyomyces aquaticus TaxID=1231657 RepID=A0A1Y1ZUF9_9PLEO|nr:RNA dependent RNA polymerase-domain-containing protein [Clohesyomyces aquaticus]
MRKAPQLPPPGEGIQGNRGPSRPRTPTPLGPASAPRPSQRTIDFEAIIVSLESKWKLGLEIRPPTWSPHKSENNTADKVYGRIKHYYYSSSSIQTKEIIDEFEAEAAQIQGLEERLELLRMKFPPPQKSTPKTNRTTGTHTPRDDPHKPLRSPSFSQWSPVSQPAQMFQESKSPSVFDTTPETAQLSDEATDEDVPASPSPSAGRRSHAGSRASAYSPTKKRPSNDLKNEGGSPKMPRTSKGKQPLNGEPSSTQSPGRSQVFKKPSIPLFRSFQATNTADTSFEMSSQETDTTNPTANTSFQMSSQETHMTPDTTNTSFTSNATDGDAVYPKLTRTSSATMGSLDDQDLLEVTTKLEREAHSQEATRESSSYGSVDEEGLIYASMEHEIQSKEEVDITRPATPLVPGSFPPGLSESRYTPNSNQSPIRLNHYIRDIPKKDLFVENTDGMMHLPYFIRFICLRIGLENSVSLQDVAHDIGPGWLDYDNFWHTVKTHPNCVNTIIHDPKRAWSTIKKGLDGYTFKGRVVLNNRRSGPVFTMELLPLAADKSCRLQRKFGTDRFLYLTFPSLNSKTKSERFRRDDLVQIQEQFKLWFKTEHSFLGRKWRAFHLEPIKKGKMASRDSNQNGNNNRIVLFATEGQDIEEPLSLGGMMDWFFPFALNKNQSFCKAFARFDLGLSRTTPTLEFTPEQIRYVPDQLAGELPEDVSFNDPTLPWETCKDKFVVMNDGCCLVSVGAAQAIWKTYKERTGAQGPMPSAFQGRIGGAKGLWMISAESYTKDPFHLGIWIHINKSQLKFEPHECDRLGGEFDPQRLMFELVRFSTTPVPSDLHISFIPILVDRGVSPQKIEALIKNRLDFERKELLEILHDSVRMYDWAHKQGGSATRDNGRFRWQAALPHALDEKIRLLLQGGFVPLESPYLSRCLQRFIERQQLLKEKKLRIPLGKATFLYGVADPYGVLSPGEVHVQFSSAFHDESTDESYLCLNGLELLVGRQPACRRSDIQKVQAVVKSELAHLVDLVVFPTTGPFPLAGKLQGGDYDGDIFWTCWENTLVSPFKNAPAPLKDPEPSDYGIRKDTRKLTDIMDPHDLSTIDNMLTNVLEFRSSPSLLGIVTNYLEKQAYAENRIYSMTIDKLCDMHDLLVDAPKQGYSFDEENFRAYIKTLPPPINPPKPVYKQAMEKCEAAREMGEADNARERVWCFNPENLLDHLYFNVVRKHGNDTLMRVAEKFSSAKDDDEYLRYTYRWLLDQHSPIVDKEVKSLIKKLDGVYRHWNASMHDKLTSNQYNVTVDECFQRFKAILPDNPQDPEIKPWLHPFLNKDFTLWESIRASTLYSRYPGRASFVFHMAGKQLAKLKADSQFGSRSVTLPILSNMKPKPIRALVPLDGEGSEDEDDAPTDDDQVPRGPIFF